MRKLPVWILFLILSLCALPLAAAESILHFFSDIEVHPDGAMTVTETIKVRAEGRQIKRGIYRDFPTDYKDRMGNNYRVGFELQSVLRDGTPEDHFIKRQSNGVRIYFGREDVYLKSGIYTYTMTYRTHRQLGYFADHDELYWNVTGSDWAFPIEQAGARVSLP